MARCFAVADVDSGEAAVHASEKIASWVGSRGAKVILLNTRRGAYPSARKLSSIANFENLNHEAFSGYLTAGPGAASRSYGFVDCDITPSDALIKKLISHCDLLLFTGTLNTLMSISGISSVPALVCANISRAGSISATSKLIDRMLEEAGHPQPVGFVLDEHDSSLAAKLADRWHIAFWGFTADTENIVEKVLNRAAIYKSDAARPERIVSANGPNSSPELAPVSESDKTADEILMVLRTDPEFKDLRVPFGNKAAFDDLKRRIAAKARRATIDRTEVDAKDRELIVARVVDNSVGFGPIEPLLVDPDVTEIMVNGLNTIYVEKNGRIEKTGHKFDDLGQLMSVVERMVAQGNRRLDEATPMVDVRLPDGSRLNVIIPPVSVDGPAITIRRFSKRMHSLDDAISTGMLSRNVADFLAACVSARVSIVISGGTGSGKTTLLGILAGAIEQKERVITIEDAAELKLNSPHVVRLEARQAGIDGGGQVTICNLVKNALRMRPDRIIIGECRGAEVLDMLQAMNTGHEGSLTTVHANTPRDAIARLETMVLMAGVELPLASVREQIVRAIHLIVQVARAGKGERRITELTELTGMEGTTPSMQTLATYSYEKGTLEPSGMRPRFAEKLKERGITLPSL